MNKILTITLLVLPLIGCSTTKLGNAESEQRRIDRVATVSTVAANTGTHVALLKNPQYRPAFSTAVDGLDYLLANGNHDPLALREVLAALPIDELRSQEGAIIVDNAVILFDSYARDTIDLDQTKYMRPVIAGIRDGMARALDQTPPFPPVN